jgi:2-oxoisovalerate dehydrogenase E1 component alpha subunit
MRQNLQQSLLKTIFLTKKRIQRSSSFHKKRSHIFDDSNMEYETRIHFHNIKKPIPTFRVIDLEGNLIAPDYDISDKQLLLRMFETMVKLEEMDTLLLSAQRQGRISFYMTSFGEAACVIGSAAGLKDIDVIFAQYREQGALLWRGYEIQEFVDQCCGNIRDSTKGRQMPIHYSSVRLNWATVSSPLSKSKY